MLPVGEVHPRSIYVLGVDVARLGEDSCVYIVVEQPMDTDELYVVFIHEEQYKKTHQVTGRIEYLHSKFRFRKIFIDETGVGGGVADTCERSMGMTVTGITFTQQMKVDMYNNLKNHMERGRLRFAKPESKSPKDSYHKLQLQLSDMRYKFSEGSYSGKLYSIYHGEGGHDDYCDALALALWNWRKKTGRKPLVYTGGSS